MSRELRQLDFSEEASIKRWIEDNPSAVATSPELCEELRFGDLYDDSPLDDPLVRAQHLLKIGMTDSACWLLEKTLVKCKKHRLPGLLALLSEAYNNRGDVNRAFNARAAFITLSSHLRTAHQKTLVCQRRQTDNLQLAA